MTTNAPPPKRQTTLLIGGSNGTAALCAILGDVSNPHNANHVIRVATRSPSKFLEEKTKTPRTWRCEEQKPFSDLAPFPFLPSRWVVHSGAPDSVFDYSRDDEKNNADSDEYSELEKAISGIGTHDDGGVADVILLCCPVSAHLSILRRIASALYKLDARGALTSSVNNNAPPIFIGTLYAAGGFDWMSRIAFTSMKPPSFSGVWKRKLALFGLKAFPYLVKSLEVGKVTLYGRFPQLIAALSPSTPRNRLYGKVLLDRVLQAEDTGKELTWVGLSSGVDCGGDGSAEWALAEGVVPGGGNMMAQAAYVASEAAATRSGGKKDAGRGSATAVATAATTAGPPPPSATQYIDPKHNLLSLPMGDYADPYSTLGFLSCTFNATNQSLHPAILVALFHDPTNPDQSNKNGTIPWDYPHTKKTPFPRFYADGAASREAGRLLSVFGAEQYPVMDAMDALLSPAGMCTISSTHGGEPVGRYILENLTKNHPRDLGLRSGLTEAVLKREHRLVFSGGNDANEDNDVQDDELDGLDKSTLKRLNYSEPLSILASKVLSNNTRLGQVLSPAEPVEVDNPIITKDGRKMRYIKPKPYTRFFLDDVPNGLCVFLGLAEMMGFVVERDMPEILAVVRKLQTWMGKEYVKPAASEASTIDRNGSRKEGKWQKRVIQGARDLNETAAPQAFGVTTIEELKTFLAMSPFAENRQISMERNLRQSGLVSKL